MKLTISRVLEMLQERIVEAPEEDLKNLFELLGLKLKEFKNILSAKEYVFEVHYQRTYVIKVRAERNTKLVSFSNEYINFGESLSGISMGLDDVKDLILTLFGLMDQLRVRYEATCSWDEESEYTQQELFDIVKALNEGLFGK